MREVPRARLVLNCQWNLVEIGATLLKRGVDILNVGPLGMGQGRMMMIDH